MPNTLEVAINAEAAKRGATKYNAATDSMGVHTTRVDRKVKKLDNSLMGMGGSIKTMLGPMAGLFAGFTALAGIRGIIATMGAFENIMAQVRGVTSASIEEFKALQQQAKFLGATTKFSATEAGEGLLFLARAGFTVEQSLAAIRPVLRFAQANVIDLGTAADLVSNIMTQFGITAAETSKATDILTLSANSANTNVIQLAEGMKYVGPVAGKLGITLEETAAAMGILGNAGIQASQAGTSLRAILSSLIRPTGGAADAIVDLGLTLKDLDPTTKSLTEIFEQLGKAEIGAKEALDIFGRRAVGAGLQMSEFVKVIEILTHANFEAAGEVEKLANLMDDTLVGATANVKSAMQAVALEAGDAGLLGALKGLLNTISDVIRLMLGMEDAMLGNAEVAKNWAAALRALSVVLGIIIAQKIAMIFYGIGAAMITAATSASGLAIALAGVLAVFIAFKLGEYFYDEFRIVQESAQKLITFFGRMWIELRTGVEVLIKTINWSFEQLMHDIISFFAEGVVQVGVLITSIEGMISKLPWLSDIMGTGKAISDAAGGFASQFDPGSFKEAIQPLLNKRNADIKRLIEVEEMVMADIAKEFGNTTRKGTKLMAEVAANFIKIRDAINRAFTSDSLNLQGYQGPAGTVKGIPTPDDVKELNRVLVLLNETAGDMGTTFARAFEDFAVGAKSASEAAKQLARDILRLVMRQAVTQPLAAGLSAGIKSVAEGIFGTPATGGGDAATTQSPFSFTSPEGLGATPTININNQSGTPLTSSQASMTFNPREFVVNVVVDDYNKGGPTRNMLG